MRSWWLLLILLTPAAGGESPLRPPAKPAAPPSPEEVRKAREDAVRWVMAKQFGDGYWGQLKVGKGRHEFRAGLAALALYALLECGVPPDDPKVVAGFAYLDTKEYRIPLGTYERIALVLALTARTRAQGKPGSKDRKWLKELLGALVDGWHRSGWRYAPGMRNPGKISQDMSHTHFAMLALHEVHDLGLLKRMKLRGLPRFKEVVRGTVLWTLAQQETKGTARGWAYASKSRVPRESRVTGSMTAAGVATLLMGRGLLKKLDPKGYAKDAELEKRISSAIADGVAWLDLHWTVACNPPKETPGNYHCVYLWGLRRIGTLTGQKKIGKHDWYAEGTAWLVQNRKKDGFWDRADTVKPYDFVNTCFALLFLGERQPK